MLLTPPVVTGALKGITRQAALDSALELGLKVQECNLCRYDVWVADECFLTGTAAEMVPVVEVDGRLIGDGKPGSTTLRLLEVFHKRVRKEGTML